MQRQDPADVKSSMLQRQYSGRDACVKLVDRVLRDLAGVYPCKSANYPADTISMENLGGSHPDDIAHSAALMRVNYSGEVCAQALYEAQALTARSPEIQKKLHNAAQEEREHLAWCAQRIHELGGHVSYFNPVWYLGSWLIGLSAGFCGDAWSLGFIAETEAQVVAHLTRHLDSLPQKDEASRRIVLKMREDEYLHGRTASRLGARVLPSWVKTVMTGLSKVMTTVAYRF